MTVSHRIVLTAALGLLLGASTAGADGLRYVELQRNLANGVTGLNGARGVTVSPDGRHIYAVSKLDDAIDVFSRDNATGRLQFVESHVHNSVTDGLNGASAVAVSPDGKHVYVGSFVDDALVAFSRDADTGALTFVQMKRDGGKINGLDGAESVVLSPDGNFIYVAATNDDAVSVFARDPNTGMMTFVEFQKVNVNGVQGLLGARGVAVSPDGANLYVAGANDDALAVFSRDAVTGKLGYIEVQRNLVNGVDGLDKARAVVVSPDGANVYVAGGLSDAVVDFRRDPATGALTFMQVEKDSTGGVNGLNGSSAVAISPDGMHVYVTGDVDDSLAIFRRELDGRLTYVGREHDDVNGIDGLNVADGVVVSPDSLSVYTVGYVDDAVGVFRLKFCGDGIVDQGEQCDDGNARSGDCCSAACQLEAAGSACTDDGNLCTDDRCDAIGACQHTNNTAPCDDGAYCTENDTCQDGACLGAARDCSRLSDPCNDGLCDENLDACVAQPKTDGTTCNDGDACTRADVCQAGVCTGTNPVICAVADQCHDAGVCNPATGECSNQKPDGTACNDDDACTRTDACHGGTCSGADPVVCTASDQCHDAGSCDPVSGACSNPAKADGAVCDDGNPCTRVDACDDGACTGGDPVVCTPTDSCHDAGICNPASGQCSNPAKVDGASCDDSDACTRTDTCSDGVCLGGDPIVCGAADQCHDAGVCNPASGACSNPARLNGSTCDDGNACTRTDTCQGGTCSGADPVVCSAPDQCHTAACSAATGQCAATAKSDGTACDDGDAHTARDVCVAGACRGAALADTDGDGIPDIRDVCPEVYDPAQTDSNHDGVGDACQCTAPAPGRCVPGGGVPTSDCLAEFNPMGPSTPNRLGTGVLGVLRCKDGDPACDRDGKADGQCTFGVALCFANDDPRLARCHPAEVHNFEVMSPNPDKAKSSLDRANGLALERTLGAMGLEIRRGSRIVTAFSAQSGQDVCSPLVDLVVAIKGKKPGRRTFAMRTTATDGRTDIDRLTLECDR